jgi:hypothetical protein
MLLIFMFCGKILSSGKRGRRMDRLDKTVAKQMNISRSGARRTAKKYLRSTSSLT